MRTEAQSKTANTDRDLVYEGLAYPAVNVYFSPRVFQSKINHRSIPMCAYSKKVVANNLT